MEVLAFFFLVVALVVLAVLGGGVYLIAARLRQKQLGPDEDRVEGPTQQPGRRGERGRPEHVELDGAQRTRFVGSR